MTITTINIHTRPPVREKNLTNASNDKPSIPFGEMIDRHTLDDATLKKVRDALDEQETHKSVTQKIVDIDTGNGTLMPVKQIVRKRTAFKGVWRITHLPSRTVYSNVDSILQWCHTHYAEYDYRTPKTLYSTLFDVLKNGITDDGNTFQKKTNRSKWCLEKMA
jgi:hypothetical protein